MFSDLFKAGIKERHIIGYVGKTAYASMLIILFNQNIKQNPPLIVSTLVNSENAIQIFVLSLIRNLGKNSQNKNWWLLSDITSDKTIYREVLKSSSALHQGCYFSITNHFPYLL